MKLMDLYSEKIVNMNFIDNNSLSGLVEQPIREPENEGEAEPVEEETTEGRADLEEQPVENEASVEENPVNDNQPSEENGQEEPLPISKRDARDILISKIEEMMADAEEHEEEFSILNLELLPKELDGNKVEVEISEERAKVKVADYTFFIDKDFMLTEE